MTSQHEHEPPCEPSLIRPVILCGGKGARLWPVSRAHFPKQLADFGGGPSLLQDTLRRVGGARFSQPILVTGEEYRFIVRDQAAEATAEPECFILERAGRNTAPAVALAAQWLDARCADELVLVLPSDHVIDDPRGFEAAVHAAIPAAEAGKLVTFGISPTSADPGFGYIRFAEPKSGAAFHDVLEFIEKPEFATASGLLESGDYLWNAGILLFRVKAFLAELANHAPEVSAWAKAAVAQGASDGDFFRPKEEPDNLPCPTISVDHALLEKSREIVVVSADMGWSDLGSWNAVRDRARQDASGNAVRGNVVTLETGDSLIYSYGGATVATVGVKDLIVVATPDAILVAPSDRAEDVRKVVDELHNRGDLSGEMPSVIHRPWGTYQTTDRDERFQTKRIVVKPGAKLSSQLHHHRSEHWVVVSGTAEVTVGEKTFLLHENQSTYISAGTVHRLANPGRVPLHLVEVQCGTYLGEDDIVRFEDVYGRAGDEPKG